MTKDKKVSTSFARQIAVDAIAIAGIYVCFMYNSYQIEKITKKNYDGLRNNLKTTPLVISNFFNILVSLPVALYQRMNSKLLFNSKVALASSLMFMGQRLTFESLYDLPYLFFVLLRSSKSISFTLGAFIIGLIFPKKQHLSVKDVCFGLVITAGLVIFNLADTKENNKEFIFLPLAFSIIGLIFESISGFFQEEIRKVFKPTAFEFMFFTSFYIGLLACLMMFLTGEHEESLHLFSSSRAALWDQLVVAVTGSLGNVFIFSLLSSRGPIVLALVTTTRKVFSVLLSAHSSAIKLAGLKGVGIGIVVGGILLESYSSMKKKKEPEATPVPLEGKKDKPE